MVGLMPFPLTANELVEARLASPPTTGNAVSHSPATTSTVSQSIVAKAVIDGNSTQTSDFQIDRETRLGNLIGFHRHYTETGDPDDQIGWTGNLSACDPGTISADFHDRVLRRINYFRGQAGLPANIQFTDAKNLASQQTAMVMARQKALSHTPLTDFGNNPCVTQATDDTARISNLALGTFGYASIDRLMLDDGSHNGPVGHRRWFLYPRVIEMGHGSIPFVSNYTSACVVWVVGDFIPSPDPQVVTWPNEGYCPYHLAPNDSASYPRWSFTYPQADFSSAQVSMTLNGESVSITKEPLASHIGDNTLVWRPSGIPSSPPTPGTDSVVDVSVSNIGNAPFASYHYQVILYDPYDLQHDLALNAPAEVSIHGNNIFTFDPADAAEGYAVKVARQNSESWTEGAESLATITDNTSATYGLASTDMASSGNRSFHLLFPTFGEQGFEIERSFIPSETSILRFKRRYRFFYTSSRLKAEISDNDGASWTTIFDKPGNNSSGSSQLWDSNWVNESAVIPETHIGKPIKLRFRIHTNGSYFPWDSSKIANYYGVYLDDITVTDTTTIVGETVSELDADVSTFAFDEQTAGNVLEEGDTYLVQLAPIVGGHRFSFTSPLLVNPTNITIDQKEAWALQHFGQLRDVLTESAEDFDGDGLSNLIERALGSSPVDLEAGEDLLPVGAITEVAETNRLALQFQLPAEPHTDLIYRVEQSDDLISWQTLAIKEGADGWLAANATILVESAPPVEGRQAITVSTPQGEADAALHLRLTVEEIEE